MRETGSDKIDRPIYKTTEHVLIQKYFYVCVVMAYAYFLWNHDMFIHYRMLQFICPCQKSFYIHCIVPYFGQYFAMNGVIRIGTAK